MKDRAFERRLFPENLNEITGYIVPDTRAMVQLRNGYFKWATVCEVAAVVKDGDRKINGLRIYRVVSPTRVYDNGKFWMIPAGNPIATYAKMVRKNLPNS